MITWHQISSSQRAADYHDKALSVDGNLRSEKDVDNYYLDKSPEIFWQGNGAKVLGIEGAKVKREDFINILDGKLLNPVTGSLQDLSARGNADRRLGYDLSFAPPKSVSIMALVGGDDRIFQAIERANRSGMRWLEEHGALVRAEGGEKFRTGNLLWASVRHETSRDNDPQVHFHNVIAAVTFDTQRNTWRSLTNDHLMLLRNKADDISKATLALEIKALGYAITWSQNGRDFEINGVSKQALEVFSARSAAIDQAIRKRGFDPDAASWSMRQTAALDTRSRKLEIPYSQLHQAWKETAVAHGFDFENVRDQAMTQSQSHAFEYKTSAANNLKSVSLAIEHLSERQQAFTRPELEAYAVALGHCEISGVKQAIESHLKHHGLIERLGISESSQWFTTHRGIEIEREMIQRVIESRGKGPQVLHGSKKFDAMLSNFHERKTKELGSPFILSNEQILAAKNVLMHEDKFQGIQGDAGTGKTAALEFVKEVAQLSGWQVRGLCTTGTAAQTLQRETGIPSSTIASHFAQRTASEKMLRIEIQALKESLLRGESHFHGVKVERTESKILRARGFKTDFGTHRYTFDHKTGEIFRSPLTPLERVTEKLSQFNSHRVFELPDRSSSRAHTFHRRFRTYALSKAHEWSSHLTERMRTYEKVTNGAEILGARSALMLHKRDEHQMVVMTSLRAKEAALNNLLSFGNVQGEKTLYVLDEAGQTGVKDLQKLILDVATNPNARGLLQGDVLQNGSVAAGDGFRQFQQAVNVSTITQTRRFDNATEQTQGAIALMKSRLYAEAITLLSKTVVSNDKDLYSAVATRYLNDYTNLLYKGSIRPRVAIVTVLNEDRKLSNQAVREILKLNNFLGQENISKEHFNDSQMTSASVRSAKQLAANGVDRLVFHNLQPYTSGIQKGDVFQINLGGFSIHSNTITGVLERTGQTLTLDPERHSKFSAYKSEVREYSVGDSVESKVILTFADKTRIQNGTRGIIEEISDQSAKISWSSGEITFLNNEQLRYVDHAYAHTSIKDQGATYDRVIVVASESGAKRFHQIAAYVAATRAKEETHVITSNLSGLMKAVGIEVKNTTSLDINRENAIQVARDEAEKLLSRTSTHEFKF